MALIKISGDIGRISGPLSRLSALGSELQAFLAALGFDMVRCTKERIAIPCPPARG